MNTSLIVSILVLMDYVLLEELCTAIVPAANCLNPCFNGLCSSGSLFEQLRAREVESQSLF